MCVLTVKKRRNTNVRLGGLLILPDNHHAFILGCDSAGYYAASIQTSRRSGIENHKRSG